MASTRKILVYKLYEAFRSKIIECPDDCELGKLRDILVQIFDAYQYDGCIAIRNEISAMPPFITKVAFMYNMYRLSDYIFTVICNNDDLLGDLEMFFDDDIQIIRETDDLILIG